MSSPPNQPPVKSDGASLARVPPEKAILPAMPLRDLVVFPHAVVSILVGRNSSMGLVKKAAESGQRIMLLTQRDPSKESPSLRDLYQIGTCATVVRTVSLPDGMLQAVVEGICRGEVVGSQVSGGRLNVEVDLWYDRVETDKQTEAMRRLVVKAFEQYVAVNPSIADKALLAIRSVRSPEDLTDLVCHHLTVDAHVKQQLLEERDLRSRMKQLLAVLGPETEILELQRELDGRVRKRVEKSQKDFYLKEQLKVIEDELGGHGGDMMDLDKLEEKVRKAKMSKEAEEAALRELDQLRKTPPFSPQAAVCHNYIDWMVSLPWHKKTKDSLDLKRAQRILDEDHYGLAEPKQRILEYLAVRKLTKGSKSPILCFVGPPGVGKTSLARSVARAMKRKFVRKSLGGVRDEAEIRGHRRTYIGALPGRIIQSIKKAGTKNPVFLLDEIDKLSHDYRGDPCSALLEVLDPEENYSFSDHYLEVEFDLRDVFFVTTANMETAIPHVLRDRMEVIRLPGYSPLEKRHIATGFLVPKALKAHGLKPRNVQIADGAIDKMIRDYTREAGVRNLNRQIETLCRRVAQEVVGKGKKTFRITARNVHKHIGVPDFAFTPIDKSPIVGAVVGLAYTEYGGRAISVEVTTMKGKGRLTITGQLGDVMKESATAALSYVRAHADELGVDPTLYQKTEIHVHVPDGATPKDGPSAGVAMTVAMISALTGVQVNREIAVTGEITLLGRVLPVGGIKEKLLAAHREGIYTIIIPRENEKDLAKLPAEVKRKLSVLLSDTIDDVLPRLLLQEAKPKPRPKSRSRKARKPKTPQPLSAPPADFPVDIRP
ncbi:MAG: endopeptidase La [Planctomycetes bacterium]|nr:endopeptidase La [Planctomycetota bacterium]